MSTGTVSNVLNRPDRVAERTRVRVERAIAELGFVRQTGPAREAAHWRRSVTPRGSSLRPRPAGTERRDRRMRPLRRSLPSRRREPRCAAWPWRPDLRCRCSTAVAGARDTPLTPRGLRNESGA
ncbi:LacI family DNA-binding transcriptional regulator [Streptomyces africanus]|uniref:LacI family DNA-binding transcriptional regulator n=1 Tax=Streptomyces africanus TaxID=231024 RepID=UPI003522DA7F